MLRWYFSMLTSNMTNAGALVLAPPLLREVLLSNMRKVGEMHILGVSNHIGNFVSHYILLGVSRKISKDLCEYQAGCCQLHMLAQQSEVLASQAISLHY